MPVYQIQVDIYNIITYYLTKLNNINKIDIIYTF